MRMPWRVPAAVVPLVVLTLAACLRMSGGDCRPLSLSARTNIGSRSIALSCVLSYEANGVTYSPWCAGVRRSLLGERLGQAPTRDVVARRIEGIDPTVAIAIRDRPQWRDSECGPWNFAPAPAERRQLLEAARSVVEPRFLGSLDG